MRHIIILILYITCITFACNYEESPVQYNFDYDNAKEAAISTWEMQIDWISDQCIKHLDVVQVIETEDIETVCGQNAHGCTFIASKNPSDLIYIDYFQTKRKRLEDAVHEYLHQIESCEYTLDYYKDNPDIQYSGRNEAHYNKAVWGNQKGSVENIGKQLVKKLSYR